MNEFKKNEIKADLYSVIENLSENKSLTKKLLSDFDKKLKELGDSVELYRYYINKV
jgi:hypothetical protein